jgi:hypothetical protein
VKKGGSTVPAVAPSFCFSKGTCWPKNAGFSVGLRWAINVPGQSALPRTDGSVGATPTGRRRYEWASAVRVGARSGASYAIPGS